MIDIAIEYRQAEKNTPPVRPSLSTTNLSDLSTSMQDFTTNPPSLRNSVFCQTPPKNAELNGLNQAQDPANDPDLFFDPATQATVQRSSQANTFPLGDSDSTA